VALRERENTVKKMIIAAIGGALLTGSLLGASCANAEMPPLPQAGEYSTCGEAAQDGVFNIPEGDENYWDEGDRDGDGIACEKN
jgi:excalibur calcium-binding domain-containing protein